MYTQNPEARPKGVQCLLAWSPHLEVQGSEDQTISSMYMPIAGTSTWLPRLYPKSLHPMVSEFECLIQNPCKPILAQV